VIHPKGWLFPGQHAGKPISTRQLYRRVIQALLGHAKLENTAFYTKVATRTVRTVTSPLDKLGIFAPDPAAPGS
jgi:integrase/recombinase XerD